MLFFSYLYPSKPKIMKKLIFIPIFFIAFFANAQFKFGVGGGLNMASFSGDGATGLDGKIGINAGLLMEVKLPIELGVEADVLYSTKGGSNSSTDVRLAYFDVPVVAKLYMLKVINLQLGLQGSFLMGAEQDFDFGGVSQSSDIKDQLKGIDMGAVIGFGVDVSKFHASARYNLGFASIDDNGGDIKNNMLTITLGIWLKK